MNNALLTRVNDIVDLGIIQSKVEPPYKQEPEYSMSPTGDLG